MLALEFTDAETSGLSAAQLARNAAGGRARAATGKRDARGRLRSHAAYEAMMSDFYTWLYEIPGRAGGFGRANAAERDECGRFATDATSDKS